MEKQVIIKMVKTLKNNASTIKDATVTVFESLQWIEMLTKTSDFNSDYVSKELAELAIEAGTTARAIVWAISTSRTISSVDHYLRSLNYRKLVDLVIEIAVKGFNMSEIATYLNKLDAQIVETVDRGRFGDLYIVTYTRNKKAKAA